MSTINSLQCLLYRDLLKFFMTVTQEIPSLRGCRSRQQPKPGLHWKENSSPLTDGGAETFKQLRAPHA